jgi:hypothetical protein
MRRYLSIWAVVLVMVMVHVDWHFGRGDHHRLSLSWPYHWVTGLVTFFFLAWFCAKKWPGHPIRAALLNAVAGLIAGQVVEPLAEAAGFRVSLATVFPPERWHVFWQFFLAALVGLFMAIAVVWFRRRAATETTQ